MSNGNGKPIHRDALVESSRDDVRLAFEVERGFLTICELHARAFDEPLPIPRELEQHILRWRAMRIRHRNGDLRHAESEKKSLKVVAQWSVDENSRLRGQPITKIQWGD